jgi:carbon starvation protein CstA
MGKRKEKKKWKFFWKNIGGLGRLNRMIAGIALIAAAALSREDKMKSAALAGTGAVFLVDAYLAWCSLRALLKKPSKRAYLRHYPKAD